MLSRLWTALLKAAPLRLWALIAAGPALTLAETGLILILWSAAWPVELRAEQLKYIGYVALGNAVLIGIIIVTLAAVKVRGSAGAASIEIDADDTP